MLGRRSNIWNFFDFVRRQTSNDVEGFNRNGAMRAINPLFYKCIDAIKIFDVEPEPNKIPFVQ